MATLSGWYKRSRRRTKLAVLHSVTPFTTKHIRNGIMFIDRDGRKSALDLSKDEFDRLAEQMHKLSNQRRISEAK